MDKLATKEQLARIMQMFASDQLPFDATQEFISAQSKKRSAQSRKRRKAEKLVTKKRLDWEKLFPGKGKELNDMVRPFKGWKYKLKPAISDLEKRFKKAIFWRDVPGVKVHPVSKSNLLGIDSWNSLGSSIRASLGVSQGFWWGGDPLEYALRDSFETSLHSPLEPLYRSSIEDPLVDSLHTSLYYPCWYIRADKSKEASKFKPLHELWLSGNFPVGFDKEENLLILVAD